MDIKKLKVGELYVDVRYGIIKVTELYIKGKQSGLMGDLFGKYETSDGLHKFLIFSDNSILKEEQVKDLVEFISYNSVRGEDQCCQYAVPQVSEK